MAVSDDKVTVDYLDNIAVSRNTQHNNLGVLRSLDMGMFHLAQFTRRREIEILERLGNDKVRSFSDFGSDMELMLGCIFDWFAISMASNMRTIQLMHLMDVNDWDLNDLRQRPVQYKLRDACSEYINRITPDVLQWRNKIAAHRAATDPRSEDSLSMLTYSTLPTVAYHSPYYIVGGLTLTMGDGSVATLKN